MIGIILDLLEVSDWCGVSNEIEIAKGRHEMPRTFKKGLKQIKREMIWSRRS
jgi:hypothetical protein